MFKYKCSERAHTIIHYQIIAVGAILAGAAPTRIDALEIYAKQIGLAFQIADDVLNVEGDSTMLGKAVGTDQTRGKSTYPALLGLEPAKALARKMIDTALEAIRNFDDQADPLRALAQYIIMRRH